MLQLLNDHLCQILPSVSSNTLTALETEAGSLSDPNEWVMEGYSPRRDRTTPVHLPPPLKLGQELVIGEEIPVSSPVAVAGNLLLAEGSLALYALTREGQKRWSSPLPGAFLSPAVAGDTVFVRAESGEEGYIGALQTASGEKIWQFEFPQIGSSYSNLGGHVTSPVVVNGLVLVGAGQAFYALDAGTGQVVWVFYMEEPVSSSAAVSDETVFFTDFEQLYAVDRTTGAEQWRFEPGGESIARLFAPVVNGEQVITSSGDTVYALNTSTGQLLWQWQTSLGNLIPAGAKGQQVYVKSVEQLYALDGATGTELWSFQGVNFVSLPAITAEHLYIVTRAGGKGQLRALNRSNGQELWQVEDKRLSNTAPVIANGQLYVRTVDGRLLIYEAEEVEGLSWQTLELH
jgi:outer membrane protein assembly factor BamB